VIEIVVQVTDLRLAAENGIALSVLISTR